MIGCTFIWGTTFIAQDTGMDNIGPFTFNCVRFFVGFLAVAPFFFLFEKKKIILKFNNFSLQKAMTFSIHLDPKPILMLDGCQYRGN